MRLHRVLAPLLPRFLRFDVQSLSWPHAPESRQRDVFASPRRRTVRLAKADLLRLTRRSAIRGIEVVRGEIWVTHTPATKDLLLAAGAQLRIDGGFPIVIQAIGGDAELVFETDADQPSRR